MNSFLLCLFIFATTLLLTVAIEGYLIPILKARAKQPIYEGGPKWHMSKSSTPTMGGLAFVIAVCLTLGLAVIHFIFLKGDYTAGISVLCALLFSLGNGLIGLFDDLVKLRRRDNAGLTPRQKLGLQFLMAIIFLMARRFYFDDSGVISLSFGTLDLGMLYYPLAILLLLGVVNCANLTDGIDGLASSVSLTVGIVFAAISAVASFGDAGVISSALIGASLGFLIFNKHPAKIFMGDTGSLFLGALAVSLAFSAENPFAILLIGGVYVLEGASVILQVLCYKLTKKRIFKMAPLHHHLEKCGFSENKICAVAIAFSAFTSVIAYIIFGW